MSGRGDWNPTQGLVLAVVLGLITWAAAITLVVLAVAR